MRAFVKQMRRPDAKCTFIYPFFFLAHALSLLSLFACISRWLRWFSSSFGVSKG